MEELSRQYSMACEQLRTVGLASTAPEKLARLLLEWSETGQTTECGTRFAFLADARGDRRIYRGLARDRYAHAERLQDSPAGGVQRLDAYNSEPGGAGEFRALLRSLTACRCINYEVPQVPISGSCVKHDLREAGKVTRSET